MVNTITCMLMALREAYSEDNGRISILRIMCFMCLVNAIWLSNHGATIDIQTVWMGGAFAAKIVQKPMEKGVTQ